MNSFFPMSRGDLLLLTALVVFSIISFMPWSRTAVWNGMVMQGWMMALLMVLAPTLALTRLLFARRNGESEARDD